MNDIDWREVFGNLGIKVLAYRFCSFGLWARPQYHALITIAHQETRGSSGDADQLQPQAKGQSKREEVSTEIFHDMEKRLWRRDKV
jgi:hypothetical protein